MIITVKDREAFLNNIVGADSFLEYWPELETTGVGVLFVAKHGFWYIVTSDGSIASDSAFFTKDEMHYLTSTGCVNEDTTNVTTIK